MSEFQFGFFYLPLEDMIPVSSTSRRVGRVVGTASAVSDEVVFARTG